MTIRELNVLFKARVPKGRQRTEIRAAAEVRMAAKALALAVLRSTPAGPARDGWIKRLRDDIETGFPAIDLAPFRPREGN